MTDELSEQRAAERRAAERMHDSQERGNLAQFTTVNNYSAEATKAAALISGGSAAATLAFMAQLTAKGNTELASWLLWPLGRFGLALFLACASTSLAYICQFIYAQAERAVTYHWDWPYIRNMPSRKWLVRCAVAVHVLAVIAVFAVYISLLVGYLAVYKAIETVGFHA